MTLTRKTRASGISKVVTLPSQIIKAYDISCGNLLEITPMKNGEIRIKKIFPIKNIKIFFESKM